MDWLGTIAAMPILDMVDPAPPKPVQGPAPKIQEIQTVLAKAYGITVSEMRGKSRVRKYARPRQIAAALCRELTTQSYPQIGRMFGDRDHTTILFAARVIGARESIDQKFADEMARHRKAIAEAVASRDTTAAIIPPPQPVGSPSMRQVLKTKYQPAEMVT